MRPMVDYVGSATQKRPPLRAELQVALNLIPAHTWYAMLSGGLAFVSERCADYANPALQRLTGLNSDQINQAEIGRASSERPLPRSCGGG